MGLVRDGVVVAEGSFPSRYTLVKRFIPRLEWLLSEAGVSQDELQAVAVARGPGAFTGVRIGLAAAKTLAQWRQIPLVGVSTLEAIAYPFRRCADTLLAPMINARRQQAYTAFFRSEGGALRRLSADLVLSAEPFVEAVHQHIDGLPHLLLPGQADSLPPAFHESLPGVVCPVYSIITAHALAALATARLEQGDVDDPMTLAPIYLRSAAD